MCTSLPRERATFRLLRGVQRPYNGRVSSAYRPCNVGAPRVWRRSGGVTVPGGTPRKRFSMMSAASSDELFSGEESVATPRQTQRAKITRMNTAAALSAKMELCLSESFAEQVSNRPSVAQTACNRPSVADGL